MAGIRRGDIHRVRFGKASGRSQAGVRPAVVLQSDALAPLSTVVVAPLSRSASAGRFRPVVAVDGTPTTVMTDQMTAVDISKVGKRLARLHADEAVELDSAIRLVLGLR
ncbi:MAG: type II toxin-antitoxin system PemK/MazF family toxin [Miltoncostaeaceae bacterium]|jgi:mRNA interferase MazF